MRRRGGRLPVGRPLLFAALLLGIGTSDSIASSTLIVEDLVLNVDIAGRPYALEAVIARPRGGGGRLPIALIAHGSPRDRADRPTYRARAMLPQARDLAYRGWLAVVFLRRGFGGSQGPFAEGFQCSSPNFRKALATAAEDIEAVRVAVGRRADADGGRVLGLGVSVGGAAMLAWSVSHPGGLAGIINLSGGTGALLPERNCDEDGLVAVFAELGARSRVPSLWLYAANDGLFGPALVRRLHDAFTRAGARAELIMFDPVGQDGHQLWQLSEGRRLWLPALDRFLRAQGLPTWDPRPLEAVAAQLKLPARNVLGQYLGAPTEKALAVSRGKGLARFWSGTNDLPAARRKSLDVCERDSAERCDVLIENFTPVGAP